MRRVAQPALGLDPRVARSAGRGRRHRTRATETVIALAAMSARPCFRGPGRRPRARFFFQKSSAFMGMHAVGPRTSSGSSIFSGSWQRFRHSGRLPASNALLRRRERPKRAWRSRTSSSAFPSLGSAPGPSVLEIDRTIPSRQPHVSASRRLSRADLPHFYPFPAAPDGGRTARGLAGPIQGDETTILRFPFFSKIRSWPFF